MNNRNLQLLERFAAHPLKASLEKLLASSESMSARAARSRENPSLTHAGQVKEVEVHARAALRDVRNVRDQIAEMSARREALQAGVGKQVFDKSDPVAAGNRRELRLVLSGLPMVKRIRILSEDSTFRDAALEQHPLASGLEEAGELDLYARLEKAQIEHLHAPALREIAALDEQVAAASAVVGVVRSDVKHAMRLDDFGFEGFAKPIETRADAPWLMRDGQRVLRVVPGAANYPEATEAERQNGKFYRDHAEFLADRGAA